MKRANSGDSIKVHYTGKLENGETFDSSKGREPLAFVIGEGNVIPGFEQGVIGMQIGEVRQVSIPAENAYGNRHEELIMVLNRTEFPDDIIPERGLALQMVREDGLPVNVMITDFSDETITLDANHPLAGFTLIFDIELVEIS